jgi:hypothetical protein
MLAGQMVGPVKYCLVIAHLFQIFDKDIWRNGGFGTYITKIRRTLQFSHYPRHAKRYRNFVAESACLQNERIAAFSEFAGDVKTGAYPVTGHGGITQEEMKSFKKMFSSSKS